MHKSKSQIKYIFYRIEAKGIAYEGSWEITERKGRSFQYEGNYKILTLLDYSGDLQKLKKNKENINNLW